MSELKTYIAPTPDGTGLADYYLKSEVDKVISELKDKCQMHDFFWEGCGFKKLGFKNSIDVRDYCDALKRQNEDLLQKCRKANKELRHHKYRRCLAMVKYCDMGLTYYNEKLDSFSCERADFFYKWYNRWWKLAEKFKEAK